MNADRMVLVGQLLTGVLVSATSLALVWSVGKNANGTTAKKPPSDRDNERYRQDLEKLQRRMKTRADRKALALIKASQDPNLSSEKASDA